MRLISLQLENFRQHKDTSIEFIDGITIINGSNGSGKSTVLEAICWAIYGIEAAYGNKDTIKWNKAPARSKVKVELIFSLDNQNYRVVRWLDKAEVYLEGNPAPVVSSQVEVTKYLTNKLGMTREEFYNTYFTRQKELNFLGNKSTSERKKFISKVLGYEKLRESLEQARADKNSLNNEIIGIKQGLGDYECLANDRREAELRVENAGKNLVLKNNFLDKQNQELGKITPEWLKILKTKEDYNKYSSELGFVRDKIQDITKNITTLKDEEHVLEANIKKLKELEPYIEAYKLAEKEVSEKEKFQKHEFERQKLLALLENAQNEININEKKIAEILESAEGNKDIPARIPELKTEIDDLKQKVEISTKKWNDQKQEIKTIIEQKQKELERTLKQKGVIEKKGREGSCPVCERALRDEFDKVIEGFKRNIDEINQEINKLQLECEAMKPMPAELEQNKTLLEIKEREFENLNKIQGQFEEKIKIFEKIKLEITQKNENKAKIEESLKNIPSGFDKELFDKLKAKFSELKGKYEEGLALKAKITDKDNLKTQLQSTVENLDISKTKQKELEEKLMELNFSEETFKKAEEAVNTAQKASTEAKYEVIKAEGDLKEAQSILSRIIEDEKAFKERQELVAGKQKELNYLSELDRFLVDFIETLNNKARPELSEYASRFLSELTDGRYSILELNDKYEICLYDDGEIKPVISGGEEDIANLCIRLAISQLIAQRSGKTLSLLILDEVFGSLDENRRNNVVSLLYSLTNNFDQVILITHIDDIKENIDNIIKVEYDEELGCSFVSGSLNNLSDSPIESR